MATRSGCDGPGRPEPVRASCRTGRSPSRRARARTRRLRCRWPISGSDSAGNLTPIGRPPVLQPLHAVPDSRLRVDRDPLAPRLRHSGAVPLRPYAPGRGYAPLHGSRQNWGADHPEPDVVVHSRRADAEAVRGPAVVGVAGKAAAADPPSRAARTEHIRICVIEAPHYLSERPPAGSSRFACERVPTALAGRGCDPGAPLKSTWVAKHPRPSDGPARLRHCVQGLGNALC